MNLRTVTYNNFRTIGILIALLGFFSYSNAQVVFRSIDELFAYADDNAIILKALLKTQGIRWNLDKKHLISFSPILEIAK